MVRRNLIGTPQNAAAPDRFTIKKACGSVGTEERISFQIPLLVETFGKKIFELAGFDFLARRKF